MVNGQQGLGRPRLDRPRAGSNASTRTRSGSPCRRRRSRTTWCSNAATARRLLIYGRPSGNKADHTQVRFWSTDIDKDVAELAAQRRRVRRVRHRHLQDRRPRRHHDRHRPLSVVQGSRRQHHRLVPTRVIRGLVKDRRVPRGRRRSAVIPDPGTSVDRHESDFVTRECQRGVGGQPWPIVGRFCNFAPTPRYPHRHPVGRHSPGMNGNSAVSHWPNGERDRSGRSLCS